MEIKVMNENRYRLFVTPKAFIKMRSYVDLCDKEVGWMGIIKDMGNLGFLVEDVYLFKQEVHAATTEITPEGLREMYAEIGKEGMANLLFWGHSHVNMGVTPSSQDDKQAEEMFDDKSDFFVRIIMNKSGKSQTTIYDVQKGIKAIIDEMQIYYPEEMGMRELIREEIKVKVKEKSYATTATTPSAASGTAYSSYGGKYSERDDYYKSLGKGKSKGKTNNPVTLSAKQAVSGITIAEALGMDGYRMEYLAL